ncbi:glycosyltransferase, partial [Bacteroidia bacterium]|nr:glycosyltransferase [Bacteroidia bacterium]
VSSFHEPKDQITVIESLLNLSANVLLSFVGSGKLLKKTKLLVNELNLKNQVIFLGLRSDIPQLLKSADIVVLSSKYEGMSLSSIEGMASGRPFVASDVPGLSDIVAGAGVLFPQGDSKQLSIEINRLLENEQHYVNVVQQCQERAALYDVSTMVDEHIILYKSVYEGE